ncbi:MAG: Gfo/Idh/MocA family oxidoreductase [Bacteroidota bacterium]
MSKVSWGILGTGKIGLEKVIPAMQKGTYSKIDAIASRNLANARQASSALGIPQAYGSYEALLADSTIQAVYIPLPNHLHVEWAIKSLQAGKHVLCEKPIAMNFKDAEYLQIQAKKFPRLKLMEAFMYRHHPQILKAKELIKHGTIGNLRNIHTMFSYYNDNPKDIRNNPEIGGGGLLDIGCYCISLSRFLFDDEPKRVCAIVEYDPTLKVDRLASAILEFEEGVSTITCSTQLADHQYAKIFGTQGRIEIERPFTPNPGQQSRIVQFFGADKREIVFDACNQYTIQGDLFSLSIKNDTPVPTPIADGVANMRVIDRIIESSNKGAWVKI